METTSVFTFIKKYSVIIGILALLLLSGCQQNMAMEPIDPSSAGFFDQYFVLPFSQLIKWIAGIFNENYGLSIIIITLLIRFAIMPFILKQTKNGVQMKEKMNGMKPELDALNEKYKEKKDTESKAKMQQEMMQLYQKHDMNPLASLGGCLPMIIQMPILIGFYYAIRRTPEIATHSFLWFDLGQTDIILTVAAVVIYFFQFKVSQIGMDPKMKQQMAFMGMLSPIMIGIISLSAPSALPLYWAVGGIFMIVQTLISRKIYTTAAASN
ncbi:membrane protein insertase YidC [Oceanobacillus halophilus]|uniref:Membrane protein insertase YidC n=1 Tax=Oceanobacillus halophilus TaxID=930130 RepID=A0A495A360_9BACI|nr:membrane protein insertase YidC [Oceanobacillus halophilus]RKQ33953.1 membrane protein insertase YidC [Oceanobacillus halophilus]